MHFQKDNVISNALYSSEEEGDFRIACKRSLSHQLTNPKPIISIFTMGMINRILKCYADEDYELTDIDKELLHGFVSLKMNQNITPREIPEEQVQTASVNASVVPGVLSQSEIHIDEQQHEMATLPITQN